MECRLESDFRICISKYIIAKQQGLIKQHGLWVHVCRTLICIFCRSYEIHYCSLFFAFSWNSFVLLIFILIGTIYKYYPPNLQIGPYFVYLCLILNKKVIGNCKKKHYMIMGKYESICHTRCDKRSHFFWFHPKDRPIQSLLTTHKLIYGGSILTRILMGHHSVASYDTQGMLRTYS
jgi:hypothetical protein